MKPSFKKQIERVKGKWYYEEYKEYLKIKDDGSNILEIALLYIANCI